MKKTVEKLVVVGMDEVSLIIVILSLPLEFKNAVLFFWVHTS